MADDPKKKKADSKRQSQQKHEVAYRRRKSISGKMSRGLARAERKLERLVS
jgi:hypothetical protein